MALEATIRTRTMTWWKAASLDLSIALVTSGLVAIIMRQWLAQREQVAWPTTVATVTAHKQGPGFKGRSGTYLVGHYESGGETLEFSVAWGPSDLTPPGAGPRSWVPPKGTPPLGSTILVHVDPRRPAVVALEDGPTVVSTTRTLATVAVVLLLATGFGIAVWFM